MEKLKRLLYEKCIDYTVIEEGQRIRIDNLPLEIVNKGGGWFSLNGRGYSGIIEYTAQYIADKVEKYFVDEMELLRKGAEYCEITNCPYKEEFLPCAAANSCAGYDLGV